MFPGRGTAPKHEATPGPVAGVAVGSGPLRQDGEALGSIDSRPESVGLSAPDDGSVLGASTLGAAELPVFVVGFDDAAGELHAARAAIIARAIKSRLNMEYSSAASADGMPALGLGLSWPPRAAHSRP